MTPGRLGMTVALDLSTVLERDPNADLESYLKEQYAQYEHPFFVMLANGRVITIGSDSFPEPLLRMARARLAGREGPREGGRFEGPDGRRGDRGGPGGPPRGGRGFGPAGASARSAIIVDGAMVGVSSSHRRRCSVFYWAAMRRD
jgi:hypothetical protein